MLCDARVVISSKGTSRIKLQHPTTREDPDRKLQLTNKRRETFGAGILVFLWMLDVGCLSGADSCRSNEFVKASKLAPFRHDQIAVLINRSAVRRVADAFFPLIGRQSKIGSLFLIGIVAELGGDPPLLIQNGYSALQLGKDGIIAADMNRCRHAKVLLNDFHEVAIEIPILDAIVIAIAN